MKFLKITPLGMADGQPHYRCRLTLADGSRHRLKVSHADLASPLAFNRAAKARLGKEVVSIGTSRSEWEGAVHHALVKTRAAAFDNTCQGDAAIRQCASRVLARIQEFLSSPESGDADALEEILQEALEAISTDTNS